MNHIPIFAAKIFISSNLVCCERLECGISVSIALDEIQFISVLLTSVDHKEDFI